MKLLHCATSSMSVRYILLNQLSWLRDREFDVQAAAGIWRPEDVASIEARGIIFHPLPLSRAIGDIKGDLSSLVRLILLIRRERFDIVHTHTPKASILGQLAARWMRVPCRVHTIHGLYLPIHLPKLQRWLLLQAEALVLRSAHRNLSQSAEDVELIRRTKLCDSAKVIYLGNGIDLNRFAPPRNGGVRAQARRELAIPHTARVLGIVARLVIEKGVVELLDAFTRLISRLPDLHLVVVGNLEPKKNDALDSRIFVDARFRNQIRYVGFRDDVQSLYAAMDVFALPSHREGFPRSAMEAAAMGLPLVLSDIRGCREVVTPGENGLLVPPLDVGRLTDALFDLLSNAQQREHMGRRSREIAIERFDERAVFRLVEATYRELLPGDAAVVGGGWPPREQ